MYLLQKKGLTVYVVTLPHEKDPDALLSMGEAGEQAFEEALEGAKPLVLQHLFSVKGSLAEEGKRRSAVESLFGGLAELEETEIAPYVSQIAGELGLYAHEFWQQFRTYIGRKQIREVSPHASGQSGLKQDLEAALCYLLWKEPAFRDEARVADVLSLFASPVAKEVALALFHESPDHLQARWLALGDVAPMELIACGGVFCESLNLRKDLKSDLDPADEWDIVISGLRYRRDKDKMRDLSLKMKRGEATGAEMEEYVSLSARLKKRGDPPAANENI
jgi:DNA primase